MLLVVNLSETVVILLTKSSVIIILCASTSFSRWLPLRNVLDSESGKWSNVLRASTKDVYQPLLSLLFFGLMMFDNDMTKPRERLLLLYPDRSPPRVYNGTAVSTIHLLWRYIVGIRLWQGLVKSSI